MCVCARAHEREFDRTSNTSRNCVRSCAFISLSRCILRIAFFRFYSTKSLNKFVSNVLLALSVIHSYLFIPFLIWSWSFFCCCRCCCCCCYYSRCCRCCSLILASSSSLCSKYLCNSVCHCTGKSISLLVVWSVILAFHRISSSSFHARCLHIPFSIALASDLSLSI